VLPSVHPAGSLTKFLISRVKTMRRSLLPFVFASGFANAQASWKVGQEVKTTSGTVIGQASKWQPEVSEYLGIPFAKAPEGELRWAAPQAITDASKVINATKYVKSSTIRQHCKVFTDFILGLVSRLRNYR
jgi:hypothetical protein